MENSLFELFLKKSNTTFFTEDIYLEDTKYLNLSRTALEIKSSVGAEPHDMYVYLKHQNKFVNKLLPSILNRVVPKNSWEQRSPFK